MPDDVALMTMTSSSGDLTQPRLRNEFAPFETQETRGSESVRDDVASMILPPVLTLGTQASAMNSFSLK